MRGKNYQLICNSVIDLKKLDYGGGGIRQEKMYFIISIN